MTSRPEPLRFQVARDYLASAKDVGDAELIASARRYYRSLTDGIACLPADQETYRDWLNTH